MFPPLALWLLIGWLVSAHCAVVWKGSVLELVPTAPCLLARQQYKILSCILQYCFHWQKIFYLSSLLHPLPRISCYFHLKHVGIFQSIQLRTVVFSINRYVTKEILFHWGYLVFEIHEKVSARYKDIPQDNVSWVDILNFAASSQVPLLSFKVFYFHEWCDFCTQCS